jgi:hypothetical protein
MNSPGSNASEYRSTLRALVFEGAHKNSFGGNFITVSGTDNNILVNK